MERRREIIHESFSLFTKALYSHKSQDDEAKVRPSTISVGCYLNLFFREFEFVPDEHLGPEYTKVSSIAKRTH